MSELETIMITKNEEEMDLYLDDKSSKQIIADIEAYAAKRADKGAIEQAITLLRGMLADTDK